MKNILLCCAVAAALLTVGVARGDDTAAAPTDAPKTKVICKKEPIIGTRLTQRICKTPEQLETEKQNAKEATEAFQRDGDFQLHGGA